MGFLEFLFVLAVLSVDFLFSCRLLLLFLFSLFHVWLLFLRLVVPHIGCTVIVVPVSVVPAPMVIVLKGMEVFFSDLHKKKKEKTLHCSDVKHRQMFSTINT